MLQIPLARVQTVAQPGSQAAKNANPRVKYALLEYKIPRGDYKPTEPGPDDRMQRDFYEPYVNDGETQAEL